MQKDRDTSFDAFRGIAIIAVVAIHACNSCFSLQYSPADKWNFFFLLVYRQSLNFAVPAFLFISGYWMSRQTITSLKDYKAFLAKRLSRILLPYVLWSFIWFAYAIVRTHHVDLWDITFKLLTGKTVDPYYFVIMLAQLYMITPLLQYLNGKAYGLIVVLVLNTLSLSVLYVLRLYFHLPASFYTTSVAFYSWIIFYEIGLLVGNSQKKRSFSKNAHLYVLATVLISLLISEAEAMILLLRYNDLIFARYAIKFSSFLYSVCVIFGFLLVREHFKHWPRFLITSGNHAFGIFLMHPFVLLPVLKIGQGTRMAHSLQPLYQIAVVSITVTTCMVLIRFALKLLPKSFCMRVLGF